MRQLLTAVLIHIAQAFAAAGVTTLTGSTIDTAGYDGLTVKANLGAITATGTATLKLQGGNAADGSDKADIEGATVTATDADGNSIIAIEIHRPIHYRYITPVLTRATANSVVNSIEVLLYGASDEPVEQVDVSHSTALVSPELA